MADWKRCGITQSTDTFEKVVQSIQENLDDILSQLSQEVTNKVALGLALDPSMWLDTLRDVKDPKQEAEAESDERKYPWNFATKFEWEVYKTLNPSPYGYPCKQA